MKTAPLQNAHVVAYWQNMAIGFYSVGMSKLSEQALFFKRREQKSGVAL